MKWLFCHSQTKSQALLIWVKSSFPCDEKPLSTSTFENSRWPFHSAGARVVNGSLICYWQPFLNFFIIFSPLHDSHVNPSIIQGNPSSVFSFKSGSYFFNYHFVYEIIYQIKIYFQFHPSLVFLYVKLDFNYFYCYLFIWHNF
jgi:hypothetical protein